MPSCCSPVILSIATPSGSTARKGPGVLMAGLITSIVCLSWTASLRAGYVWQAAATSGPSARYDHTMVYDSIRQKVMLFGGRNTTSFFNDLWEWDSQNQSAPWTNVTPAGLKPSARYGHALAYDSNRDKIVLFGGLDGSARNDTWEWDLATGSWSQITLANSPSARLYHGMAYDPGRGQMVLYGGTPIGGALGDTWEWDGNPASGWVQKATSLGCQGPPGYGMCERFSFGMTYNGLVGAVVLFGGTGDGSNCSSSDSLYGSFDLTYRWNGIAWAWYSQGASQPSRRHKHELVWDNISDNMVLYGGDATGCVAGGGIKQDTWTWKNSTGWAQQSSASQMPRAGHAMAFDETIGATGGVVLHGGHDGSQLFGNTLVGYAIPGGTTACPPQFNLSNPSTYKHRLFYVTGNSNNIPWSWSISWGGNTIYEPNVPGVPAGSNAAALAAAFVASINSHCQGNQLLAVQINGHPDQFRVIVGGNQSFSLCVGPAGQPANCCVSSVISCPFNPVISEILLSGEDCDGNGMDDTIDLLSSPGLDGNGDGVIDTCQAAPSDLNCDGTVSGADIAGFTLALTNPAAYQDEYQDCLLINADLDGDGEVTIDDIGAFVDGLIDVEPPAPSGACCLIDGTCVDDQSQLECSEAGGAYQGDGTTCDFILCASD